MSSLGIALTIISFFLLVLGIIFTLSKATRAYWNKLNYGNTIGCGHSLPRWLACVIQEVPAVAIPTFVFIWSRGCGGGLVNGTLMLLYIFHYINRVIVYPAKACYGSRGEVFVPCIRPLICCALSIITSIVQSFSIVYFEYENEKEGFLLLKSILVPNTCTDDKACLDYMYARKFVNIIAFMRFIVGVGFFIYGASVNISSDSYLLSLHCSNDKSQISRYAPNSRRKISTKGKLVFRRSSRLAFKKDGEETLTMKYLPSSNSHQASLKIPRGQWFEYVSCPNHLGEIVEWWGFAIASNTFVALSYAIFTTVYLCTLSLEKHASYVKRFRKHYPKHRTAIIPMIL